MLLIWPRARVFWCDAGVAMWSPTAERWYSEWTTGGRLEDGMRKCYDQGTFTAQLRPHTVQVVRLRLTVVLEIILEVGACPAIERAVRAVQRRYRHTRRAQRLVAVAMAWHRRLGKGCGLAAVHSELLEAVIARFV